MKFQFSRWILEKILKCKVLGKFVLVGAQLFRTYGWTDGQTDMKKQIVALRNFAKSAQ